jgi:hypothetical protein
LSHGPRGGSIAGSRNTDQEAGRQASTQITHSIGMNSMKLTTIVIAIPIPT